MKKNLLIFVVLNLSFATYVNALWTNKTMLFGGLTRSYRVYQSPNYNPSNPASLLIALHGLGDNMTNFSTIGFHLIADTANIICIYPQAVSDVYAGTAWNSGAGSMGYYPNSTVNDIGFINALIDTAMTNYAIDHHRVYLCGFSMGGFMTQRMALQSNSRIAAFASMSGTIGSGILTYNPGRHVPIAHFHGTADGTVAYTGNSYGIDPDSLINFWVSNNACNPTPATYSYANSANDAITVDRYEYSNGDPQSDVWFYKMVGADHTVLYQPTNDITEPIELWLFLRRHVFLTAGLSSENNINKQFAVYPNPAKNQISLDLKTNQSPINTSLVLYNMQGQLLLKESVQEVVSSIDISKLKAGIYLMAITNDNGSVYKKLVKE